MVRKSWAPALIRRLISITSEGARNLPLYALSLIFPYSPYIGTLTKWIADHIDWGDGCLESSRFSTQTMASGAGPRAADARSGRQEEIGTGAAVLTLADLARWEHRQPEMHPKTSTNQGNSTAPRVTTAPPRPAKVALEEV
jgi:hypothetical protein